MLPCNSANISFKIRCLIKDLDKVNAIIVCLQANPESTFYFSSHFSRIREKTTFKVVPNPFFKESILSIQSKGNLNLKPKGTNNLRRQSVHLWSDIIKDLYSNKDVCVILSLRFVSEMSAGLQRGTLSFNADCRKVFCYQIMIYWFGNRKKRRNQLDTNSTFRLVAKWIDSECQLVNTQCIRKYKSENQNGL